MPRVRSSTTNRIHAELGSAAQAWSDPAIGSSLRPYGFRHGVAHLIASGLGTRAESLLMTFDYGMARLESESGPGVSPMLRDFRAAQSARSDNALPTLTTWAEFYRGAHHLLALGDRNWGAEKILLQLAMEHADSSPVTQAAEAWLEKDRCDWFWLRNTRRRISATPGPCLNTVLFGEDEVSSLTVWNHRLVLLVDSGCLLVVLDSEFQEAELQHEASDHTEQIIGVVATSPQRLLFWSEASIWVWRTGQLEAERLCTFEEECVIDVVEHPSCGIIITTSAGAIYAYSEDGAQPRLLHSFEPVASNGWSSPDGFLVFQLSEIEEDDEEWEDEDDDEEEWDEEEEDEDEDEDEDDEEWDDDDEDDDEDDDDNDAGLAEFLILAFDTETAAPSAKIVASESDSPIAGLLPDGPQHALSIRSDGTVERWELKTGNCLATWTSESDLQEDVPPIRILNGTVVVWTLTGDIHLLDPLTLQARACLKGHSDLVSDVVAFGTRELLSCGHDAEIRRWSLDTLSCEGVMKGDSPHGLSGLWVCDQEQVVAWGFDNYLSVWNPSTGLLLGTLRGHTSSIAELVPLPSGRLASCAMFTNDLKMWDLERLGKDTPLDQHRDVVSFAARRGARIITGSHDQTLRIWDMDSGAAEELQSDQEGPVYDVVLLPGNQAAAITNDLGMTDEIPNTITLWDLNALQQTATLDGHTDWIRGVAPLPENCLLTWSDDGDLRIWDAQTGACQTLLEGHEDAVRGAQRLGEHEWLSWSEDGTLRIWDLISHSCTHVLETHGAEIQGATSLPNGKLAAWTDASEGSAILRVWDRSDSQPALTLSSGEDEIRSVTTGAHRIWVRYAQGLTLSWDPSKPEDGPRQWTDIRLRQDAPEIRDRLIDADPTKHRVGQSVASSETHRVRLNTPGVRELQWCADGEWRIHDLNRDGLMVATNWNQLALVQLHRGKHPMGLDVL